MITTLVISIERDNLKKAMYDNATTISKSDEAKSNSKHKALVELLADMIKDELLSIDDTKKNANGK